MRGLLLLITTTKVLASICSEPYIPLRPYNLENNTNLNLFTEFRENRTLTFSGQDVKLAFGSVPRLEVSKPSEFAVVNNVLSKQQINKVIKIVREIHKEDQIGDSIDGMPVEKIYLNTYDHIIDKTSKDPITRIDNILKPVLDKIVTPLVRQQYPEQCDRDGRKCLACSSMIRHWNPNRREFLNSHVDTDSIVTFVVSLSQHGSDFTGGLYVTPSRGIQKQYIPLRKGDGVMHQFDLLHGVRVFHGQNRKVERFSWILWFKDICEETEEEKIRLRWYKKCALENDPLCFFQLMTRLNHNKDMSSEENIEASLWLTERAARLNHPRALIKLAQAYVGAVQSMILSLSLSLSLLLLLLLLLHVYS